MQCRECGKPFHPMKEHQQFCADRCRYRYHNRKKRNAAKDAADEQYRREVLAREAKLNGFTHIEMVAEPPLQLTGPKLGLLPVAVKPKSEEAA
jgi:hypothetical protein